jgi:hypothetical protein
MFDEVSNTNPPDVSLPKHPLLCVYSSYVNAYRTSLYLYSDLGIHRPTIQPKAIRGTEHEEFAEIPGAKVGVEPPDVRLYPSYFVRACLVQIGS